MRRAGVITLMHFHTDFVLNFSAREMPARPSRSLRISEMGFETREARIGLLVD